MTDEIAIRVDDVSKDFKLPHEKSGSLKDVFLNPFKRDITSEAQHALKHISFEVKKGEFFGIVGRNGSGKSTLLKILAEIYRPTEGKVYTQGKLVPFIELGVGFNPELTGRENVYLNGALLGFSHKQIDEMYDDIVEFAELGEFMDQNLKNYSSGMQVRLAFSVATRSKADILLIDEVLAVGDADFQRKCFNYFKQLKKEDTTVVFVTHDMEAVREYCDRAMLIEKNEIKHIGDVKKIAREYIKLFNEDEVNKHKLSSPDGKRWGDDSIKIEDISVDSVGNFLVIKETISAQKTTEGLISGLRIKNVAGMEITGSNTKIEGHSIRPLNKNETVVVTWTVPNVFTDGVYTVDAAVQHIDGITVADWWDEATSFTVARERVVPYIVDPGFKVKVEYE